MILRLRSEIVERFGQVLHILILFVGSILHIIILIIIHQPIKTSLIIVMESHQHHAGCGCAEEAKRTDPYGFDLFPYVDLH